MTLYVSLRQLSTFQQHLYHAKTRMINPNANKSIYQPES